MPPQVASLSELSRIRGDAGVRYPYAITQPRAFCSLGLAGAERRRTWGEGEEGFGRGGFDRGGASGKRKGREDVSRQAAAR